MQHFFECNNQLLPIIVKKRAGTKRITIRYRPLNQSVSLTLPPYASVRQGLRFVEEKRSWIVRQMERHGARKTFADGAVIPILGRDYTLRHIGGRGLIKIEGDSILVPGEARFMPRRLRDWLKETARAEIVRQVQAQAKIVGKSVAKISLRDGVSRWGSCSHHGRLSFSWRLVFAPPDVLDYVVNHEVAHLIELNHSPKFWQVVAQLCPNYAASRAWLKRHGAKLYAYH